MKTNHEALKIGNYIKDLMNIHTNQNTVDDTWKVRVWDCLGWHAQVKCGHIKMTIFENHMADDPEQKFTYSCWIELPVVHVSTIGRMQLITKHFPHPEMAYEDAIEKLKELKKLLDVNINEILGEE